MEKQQISSMSEVLDKTITKWLTGEIAMFPSTAASFMTETEKVTCVKARYELDRKKYLETKEWPTGMFYHRGFMWSYYYFLQLTDPSIQLDRYLDFDYDKEEFSRDKLIRIVAHYGLRGLLEVRMYTSKKKKLIANAPKSFDGYMINRFHEQEEMRKKQANFIIPGINQ